MTRLIGTKESVVKAWPVKRKPDEEKWNKELIGEVGLGGGGSRRAGKRAEEGGRRKSATILALILVLDQALKSAGKETVAHWEELAKLDMLPARCVASFFPDIKCQVGEEQIHANKKILISQSRFFKTMRARRKTAKSPAEKR